MAETVISLDGVPASGKIESGKIQDAINADVKVPVPNTVIPPDTDEPPAMDELEIVDEGVKPSDDKEVVTPDPDEPTVDFNEFLKNKNTESDEKLTIKPPTDKPVLDKDGKVVPLVPAVPPKDAPKDGNVRDYTGIDDKDIPHFKRMGNDAFNSFKPVYLENRKLKTDISERDTKLTKLETDYKTLKEQGPQLPESYYENPQGYLLDPDFQTTVSRATQAQQILQHWTSQYDAIAEGAKEVSMIDIDPKTGNLVETGKVPASRGVEAKLLSFINHSQNQLQNAQVSLQTKINTHQLRSTEQVNNVKQLSSTFFNGFYKTPEDKAIYEPLIAEKLQILPAAFRNSPLARVTAESLVMNQVLAQLLNKAKEEKAAVATPAPKNGKVIPPKVPVNRLNPTNGDLTGDATAGKGGEVEISLDDFERLKNGL